MYETGWCEDKSSQFLWKKTYHCKDFDMGHMRFQQPGLSLFKNMDSPEETI